MCRGYRLGLVELTFGGYRLVSVSRDAVWEGRRGAILQPLASTGAVRHLLEDGWVRRHTEPAISRRAGFGGRPAGGGVLPLPAFPFCPLFFLQSPPHLQAALAQVMIAMLGDSGADGFDAMLGDSGADGVDGDVG